MRTVPTVTETTSLGSMCSLPLSLRRRPPAAAIENFFRCHFFVSARPFSRNVARRSLSAKISGKSATTYIIEKRERRERRGEERGT
tara:strand:- start:201 stop:458 length:258 start_codon:yes stop_codon:yes gene_type:complete